MDPPPPSDGAAKRPTNVHIGRQPIFDASRRLIGHELLFRGSAGAVGAARRGPYATSQVIVNAFTEFGLNDLVGDKLCFINLTREFAAGDLPLPFESGRVVLEVLETVPVDDQVVSGILKMVDAGHRVALDSFVLGKGHEQLLTVAAFVKINISALTPAALAAAVRRCRRYPNVKLIAERIETPAQVRIARRLRFDLLQGYALGQPQTLSMPALSGTRMGSLELFGAVNAPDADLDRIMAIVNAEPALSERVLRAANSTMADPVRAMSSVREAIKTIGLARLRQWITLLLIAEVSEANDDHFSMVITRARLCQTVGERLDVPGDVCFTVGLLAGMAEVFGKPVDEIVARLPQAREIGAALAAGTGKLGQVLGTVRAYERRNLTALAAPTAAAAVLATGGADMLPRPEGVPAEAGDRS